MEIEICTLIKKKLMAKFQTNCRAFMITAVEQIKKRFDFEDDILPKLSVLDPVNALSLGREQSLLPLAMKLPRIIEQDDAILQQLNNEWRRLDRPSRRYYQHDTKNDEC